MLNAVRIKPLLLACLLMIIGIIFYTQIRGCNALFLVPLNNTSLCQTTQFNSTTISALINALPNFIHCAAFCFLTLSLVKNTPRHTALTCVSWVLIGSIFELLQLISSAPSNNLLINYFNQGTYTHLDLLAVICGGLVVYFYQKYTGNCHESVKNCGA